MAIFKRVTCPQCRHRHTLFKNVERQKKIHCKACGVEIAVDSNSAYFIEYYVDRKRRREMIGPSKVLADNVLAKRKLEIAENKFLDRREEVKVRFNDFTEEYLKIYSIPNNRAWRTADLPNTSILNRYFGQKHLHEITTHDVEKFKAERAGRVKPATVNRNLACLKSIFNRAIDWGKHSGKNPVNGVKLFKENNKRLRYLEREEITQLLRNASEKLHPILVVALNTGMRRGEILNLKWHDVDFKRDILHLYETKNGEQRDIPINQQVKEVLISVRKHPKSPYIFTYEDGSRVVDIRKPFFVALQKSGIKNFHFHDLRHTFCSQLAMSGIDLNTIRELAGHKSMHMTIRYAHLSPNHKQKAVEILGKQLNSISPALEMVDFKDFCNN